MDARVHDLLIDSKRSRSPVPSEQDAFCLQVGVRHESLESTCSQLLEASECPLDHVWIVKIKLSFMIETEADTRAGQSNFSRTLAAQVHHGCGTLTLHMPATHTRGAWEQRPQPTSKRKPFALRASKASISRRNPSIPFQDSSSEAKAPWNDLPHGRLILGRRCLACGNTS